MLHTQGDAAGKFPFNHNHSFFFPASFRAAAPQGHESTFILLLLLLFTSVAGGERGRDDAATGPRCVFCSRLFGPYEVMENFSPASGVAAECELLQLHSRQVL